jgi:intracellular septation protein
MGKLLLDFFPVMLFFIVYKSYDDPTEGIIAATAVAMVATIVQVAYTRIRHGRVENMHLITLALFIVFGGLTIVLRDEMFIKWKPSIVNWLFAVAFLGSQFIGAKTLVQRMMDKAVRVPQAIWTRLNLLWVAFFIAVGFLNLYVVYNYDTDTWVNFKLFGLLGLTFIFIIGQGIYMMRHVIEEEPTESDSSAVAPPRDGPPSDGASKP